MSEPQPPTTRRTGLPAPSTVLGEELLRPRRRRGAPPARQVVAYRVIRTNQVDPYDRELTEAELPTRGLERFVGNSFRGTARKAAKISIADAATEVFADLADLIDSLPAHPTMVDHDPPIETDAGSERVDEEVRNVRVRAFLYAASREDDNDYHLIVGRDPNEPAVYMTMELSGLPPRGSPHFGRLRAARDAYKGFFGEQLPGASYDFYDPPIEMDVEGSLFFDMSHATGSRPGPQDLRPDMPVVWEIHPISEIVLEP